MQKKLFGFLTLLVVASMVLAACGGGKRDIDVAEGTTLTIWADDTRSAILLPIADEFAELYGVEVVVEEVASIRDQFIVAAPAGEGADIFIGAHDWLGELYASGLVAALDLGDKEAEFSAASLQGCTFEGDLYCMPYAVENLAFFYNTDLVDTAPTTWEEAVTTGATLMASGAVDYGFALTGTTYDAYPLFTSQGGYIFGRDDAGNYNAQDVGLDNAGMVAAAAWIDTGVKSGFLPDSTDWDTAHVLFENGQIPFIMAGPWALDRIRASEIPYAVTTFPEDGAPFLGVQAFFVNAFSDNTLLAQAFLTDFVATTEIMTELQTAGNRPSAFGDVAANSADPDFPAFALAGENAQPMPAIAEMGSVWGAWSDGVTLVVNGESSAADAMGTAAQQVRDLIAGVNPNEGMVSLPGNWVTGAADVDCGEWSPACDNAAMTDNGDGTFTFGPVMVVAGDYELKVALDGGWDTAYGVDGGADNYPLSLAEDTLVTFVFDSATTLLDIQLGE